MCNNITKLLDLMQEIEGDFKLALLRSSYACLHGTQQAVSSLGIGRSCW